MNSSAPPHRHQDTLVSYFWSGDVIRSRSVSDLVLSGLVDLPPLPARLLADWKREAALHLQLEPGDVEALSLARARARWPGYSDGVRAASDWTRKMGLSGVLAISDVALMACRGANYHHDGAQYGSAAFCNLFLSDDRGLDVHFPAAGRRIPLTRGTVIIFDTAQPHAVIDRRSSGVDAASFPVGMDDIQMFLTWELPIEDAGVASALGISFDINASAASQLDQEQVWVNGAPASLCPKSGQWRIADQHPEKVPSSSF